jgi:uncharacterized protein (TIGR02231 family)
MPQIEAPITEVTVYPDTARITRRGRLTLSPGEQRISLVNLPVTLQSESVRVSGRGTGVKILSVDVASAYLTSAPEAAIAALQAQIDALKAQDAALEDEDRTVSGRLEMLLAAQRLAGENFGRLVAQKRATVEEYTRFAQFAGEEQSGLQNRRREIAGQRKQLQTEISALEAHMKPFQQHLHGRPITTRREIHVTVSVDADSTLFELEAHYSVSGASWEPLYDLRLTRQADAEVQLTYLASVTQRSGEAWENVALSLSTARPADSTRLPELAPRYLKPFVPRPPALPRSAAPVGAARRLRAMTLEQPEAGYAADDDEAMLAEAAELQTMMLDRAPNDLSAALTYRIPTPISIPSDGTPNKSTVTIEQMRVSLDYLTVPRISPEAFLRAKITNTSAYTLLPGEASIYHGDEFIGRTELRLIAPGEHFEVQLGVDDRVRVKRELLQREVSKRFIGGSRQMIYRYKITLTNLLPREVSITATDQLPLSDHEGIKVKLMEATPAATEQTQLNILHWTLTLKPNEKREIMFGYTVESPAEMTVVGLD